MLLLRPNKRHDEEYDGCHGYYARRRDCSNRVIGCVPADENTYEHAQKRKSEDGQSLFGCEVCLFHLSALRMSTKFVIRLVAH